MSWLIEEESMDRYVLNDIIVDEGDDGATLIGTNTVESNAITEIRNDDHNSPYDDECIEIIPPMDYVTLRNIATFTATDNSDTALLDFDDQESIRSGMTILPSNPSSSSLSFTINECPNHHHHQQQQEERVSPRQEQQQEEIQASVPLSSGELLLSINPNSIDSSVLTELSSVSNDNNVSLISSVVSEEEEEEEKQDETIERNVNLFPDVDERSGCSDFRNENGTPFLPPIDNNQQNNNNNNWYNHFSNECEWNEFYHKANQLLDAIHCPVEDRDEMITALIHEEEKLWWKKKKSSNRRNNTSNDGDEDQSTYSTYSDTDNTAMTMATTTTTTRICQHTSWLLEAVAISTTIAVTGLMIIRIIKGR